MSSFFTYECINDIYKSCKQTIERVKTTKRSDFQCAYILYAFSLVQVVKKWKTNINIKGEIRGSFLKWKVVDTWYSRREKKGSRELLHPHFEANNLATSIYVISSQQYILYRMLTNSKSWYISIQIWNISSISWQKQELI